MITKNTVKYIQSLQHKKFRDEFNIFVAEGPKVVGELLLQNKFVCEAIYITDKGMQLLQNSLANIPVDKLHLVKEYELQKISTLVAANVVVGIFKKAAAVAMLPVKNNIVLALDDVQDPGNLGTIIRTADWFGIHTIYCSLATACCYSPKVVQSTMASLARVNVVYTNLATMLAQNSLVKKYATTLHGQNITSFKKITEGILLIGNEGNGLAADILAYATDAVTIERVGGAESLNVAVATGIILHSLTR